MQRGNEAFDGGTPEAGTGARPDRGAGDEFGFADWPGADLATVPPVRLLALVQATGMRVRDQRQSLAAAAFCEQILRYVSALQLRFLVRASADPPPTSDQPPEVIRGDEAVAGEIAALFGLSPRTAQARVARARDLVTDLPGIVDLVQVGAIDLQRAGSVDEVMREVLRPGDETWEKVHDVVVDRLAERGAGNTNRWIRELTRRAIHNADPAAAARRHHQARARRRVMTDPMPDAMAAVTAVLPADQAQLVDSVLDALSDGCRDRSRAAGAPDSRTHDQRRADAFVALFRSVAAGQPLPVLRPEDAQHFAGRTAPTDTTSGLLGWWLPPDLPRQQGRRTQVTVIVSLSTLLGEDDHAADLTGHGAIPAELARAIAAEGARFRVVAVPDSDDSPAADADDKHTDEISGLRGSRAVRHAPSRGWSGHWPGDQAHCDARERGYRPAQSLVDQVVAFHQVCRHPGCARRAQRCDLDHNVSYPAGPTCRCKQVPSERVLIVAADSLNVIDPASAGQLFCRPGFVSTTLLGSSAGVPDLP
jgi:uncharacterized protein DUF222